MPSEDANAVAGSLAERSAAQQAATAAQRAGVVVRDVDGVSALKEVARLFTSVWGPSDDGSPVPADLLRSLNHAGGSTAGAYAADGVLVGACVAVRAESNRAYSLIAAVRPGRTDGGVGFALKQRQRAWALERRITEISWTFDPLVGRNARFNLTKLGARATGYLEDFFGPMGDEINAGDRSDRLLATWLLRDARVEAAAEGRWPEPVEPDWAAGEVLQTGPDTDPLLVRADGALWCRTPVDVVALRRQDPRRAADWRRALADVLTTAFLDGYSATHVTRSGWYRLVPGSVG